MMRKAISFLWSKKWLVLILVLIVAGGFWNYRRTQAKKEVIETVNPSTRDIREVLSVSGTVDADQKAILKFPAPSQLTWIGVKEGDTVKKWQGIAKVDTRTLQKQMEIAMNTQGKTFRNFEQTFADLNYYDKSGLTETERREAESAQLDLRSSVLSVEIADLAIKLAYMYSPIDGVVVKVDQPNVGALISITDTFVVVNPQSIYFSAIVDEEDISKVTSSQSATIVLDAYTDTPITATVKSVAFTPSTSESGGTGYKIKLSLPIDNTALRYKLGMNGDADVLLKEVTGVMAIPVDALIEREGKTYVDVLVNGKKEPREITIGAQDENFVQVISGLSEQDNVVVPNTPKK